MMRDPYKIDGPAIISFSGGRTSAYMTRQIMLAHGGELPNDVHVCFANTGKEMPQTLDFVRDCSEAWNLPITWLEYNDLDEPQHRWKRVDYETAARNGEPFEAVIRRRKYLPNAVTRFCTIEMKIRPMKLFAQQVLGFEHWDNVIGFRADEPRRLAKLSLPHKEPFERIAPLAKAGVSKYHVGAWWQQQPFDLQLRNDNGETLLGNCDMCFLKGLPQLLSIAQQNPTFPVWWIKQESAVQSSGLPTGDGARFSKDRPSYASILQFSQEQGDWIDYPDDAIECMGCTD